MNTEYDTDAICAAEYIPWEALRNRTVFITGATGLIGKNLVWGLLDVNRVKKLNIRMIALVRNEKKAEELFGSAVELVVGEVENIPPITAAVDYVIHAAGPTSSRYFVDRPVETLTTLLNGCKSVLALAKEKQVRGMVFLSTMEVYGYPQRGHKVTENELGVFAPTTIRNSYPLGKLLCENLCCSYAAEYDVPVKIVRLTQTFGPGVAYDDRRIFAEFARSVIENRNIILKTKGETERCYLYTADAVTAILTVLLKGGNGECYTAANPETYCSIAQMAGMVVNEIAEGKIALSYDFGSAGFGYADMLYMDLDVSKLCSLGWSAKTDLITAYRKSIEYLRSEKQQAE